MRRSLSLVEAITTVKPILSLHLSPMAAGEVTCRAGYDGTCDHIGHHLIGGKSRLIRSPPFFANWHLSENPGQPSDYSEGMLHAVVMPTLSCSV